MNVQNISAQWRILGHKYIFSLSIFYWVKTLFLLRTFKKEDKKKEKGRIFWQRAKPDRDHYVIVSSITWIPKYVTVENTPCLLNWLVYPEEFSQGNRTVDPKYLLSSVLKLQN